MEKEELLEILDETRDRRLDFDLISRFIPNADIARILIEEKLFTAFTNIPLSQPFITKFLKELLNQREIKNALDPYARVGDFLKVVNLPKERKTGFVWDQNNFKINKLIKAQFCQQLVNPMDFFNKKGGKFDLIISNLPVGLLSPIRNFGLSKRDIGLQIIIQSLHSLSDQGILIATVGHNIFQTKVAEIFIEKVKKMGFAITMIFETPPKSLNSSSHVGFFLMGIEKKSQGQIFIAEVPEIGEDISKVLNNLNKKKRERDISHGIWKNINSINSISKLKQIDEVNSLLKKINYPLKKLVPEIGIVRKEEEINGEYIKIPTFLTAKIKKGLANVNNEIKKNGYHFLELKQEEVDSDYLVMFLNSELGKKIIAKYAFGVIRSNINQSILNSIEIPLPSKTVQQEIVQLERKLKGHESYFKRTSLKLWNNPNSRSEIEKELRKKLKGKDNTEWLEELPFPIASILSEWNLEKKIDKKVDYLFWFFEGFCEFLNTIILSGLISNLQFYDDIARDWLRNKQQPKWHLSPSFGNWQYLYSLLSNKIKKSFANSPNKDEEHEYRKMIEDLFGGTNNDFFKMITSKELNVAFQYVVKLRNDYKGHGGILSDKKNREILDLLESKFYEIKDIITFGFSNTKFIEFIPGTMTPTESGIVHSRCKLLNGTKSRFKEIEVETSDTIFPNKIYYLQENHFKPIYLLPLVQIDNALNTDTTACFFYNRIDNKKVRFISYHHEKESEIYNDLESISPCLKFLNSYTEVDVNIPL